MATNTPEIRPDLAPNSEADQLRQDMEQELTHPTEEVTGIRRRGQTQAEREEHSDRGAKIIGKIVPETPTEEFHTEAVIPIPVSIKTDDEKRKFAQQLMDQSKTLSPYEQAEGLANLYKDAA